MLLLLLTNKTLISVPFLFFTSLFDQMQILYSVYEGNEFRKCMNMEMSSNVPRCDATNTCKIHFLVLVQVDEQVQRQFVWRL